MKFCCSFFIISLHKTHQKTLILFFLHVWLKLQWNAVEQREKRQPLCLTYIPSTTQVTGRAQTPRARRGYGIWCTEQVACSSNPGGGRGGGGVRKRQEATKIQRRKGARKKRTKRANWHSQSRNLTWWCRCLHSQESFGKEHASVIKEAVNSMQTAARSFSLSPCRCVIAIVDLVIERWMPYFPRRHQQHPKWVYSSITAAPFFHPWELRIYNRL